MGTETHHPALTKEIIASLLVEKRAEMLALLQRLYTTTDDTELFRLSAHRLTKQGPIVERIFSNDGGFWG